MLKKKSFWILLSLFLLVTIYFYFLNPADKTNFFLPCFFYEITGYKCSGCGTQRAFHEVLHLNFLEAFKQNAFFVLMIPYIFLVMITEFNKQKYEELRAFLLSNKTLLVLLAVTIIFGILRNL